MMMMMMIEEVEEDQYISNTIKIIENE